MTFMPWSSSIAVGLHDVDEQHRWLVDCINELHTLLHKQQPGPAPDACGTGTLLEGLMDYTMNHFIVEEELLERYGYPDTALHKAQHNKFTSTIMNALTAFEDGQRVSHDLLEFLKHWLTHHIMRIDKAYVPYLRAYGIR